MLVLQLGSKWKGQKALNDLGVSPKVHEQPSLDDASQDGDAHKLRLPFQAHRHFYLVGRLLIHSTEQLEGLLKVGLVIQSVVRQSHILPTPGFVLAKAQAPLIPRYC